MAHSKYQQRGGFMKLTAKDIDQLIQAEINWCLDNPDRDLNHDQQMGFVNGLRQAQRLIEYAHNPTVTVHVGPNIKPETQQALGQMIDAALRHYTGGALVWVCDNCKSDYNTEQTMCISCGKRKSSALRYWQHDETGRVCATVNQPSERWDEISKEQYDNHQ
jgi:hypothetical protein